MREKFRLSEGFTLVELAVVIVIIGVLAAFAVPRFRDAVERSKAGEAFHYLGTVRAAQERFHSRQGEYADASSLLDVALGTPKYFSAGSYTASETNWSLTLTRSGASAGYGSYTVIFTQEGYSTASGIETNSTINPMGT